LLTFFEEDLSKRVVNLCIAIFTQYDTIRVGPDNMKYIGIILVTLFALSACTSKEERARQDALMKERIEAAEEGIVSFGRVKLSCKRSSKRQIKVKNEKYTAFNTVVTGTKKTGGGEHCWTDVYGNVWCNSYDNTEDITTQVPYEATRDANNSKRAEFKDACGCKNKDFKFYTNGELYLGDITYSEAYLKESWINNARKAAKRSNFNASVLKFDGSRKKHCEGKKEYFKQQSWYSSIPIVKHK